MELIGFQRHWEKGSTFPVHLLVDGTEFQAVYSGKGFVIASIPTTRWNSFDSKHAGRRVPLFQYILLVEGTEFQAVVEKGSLLPVDLLQDGTCWVPNILRVGFHFSSSSLVYGTGFQAV